ncbi:hypothetical protein FA95DRAFT_1612556 [Auriscalpium vulgare]|uniref:Uncharacterized protein n=1 Tax=Auriscalpium vulgare TaxID=40419 RepID=A0ACB8R5Z8_9AGAM|nr:hypothetical protein FA95DRAFT_1612556 [Auriscalpium vulgare]
MESHIAFEITAPPRGKIVVELVLSPTELVSFASWQPDLTAGPANSAWRSATHPIAAPLASAEASSNECKSAGALVIDPKGPGALVANHRAVTVKLHVPHDASPGASVTLEEVLGRLVSK